MDTAVEQPVEKLSRIEKKVTKEMMIDFIESLYSPASGLRREVVHLWDNKFRAKFWGKNEAGDIVIRTSIFLIIKEGPKGLESSCKNEGEVNWSLIKKRKNFD